MDAIKTKLGAVLSTLKFPEKDVKIHTYTVPYSAFGNSTHIVETPNYLILVDGQYLKMFAKEFREIANSLNKPIVGMLISHNHPDHIFGITESFNDIPLFALSETIDFLKNNKEFMIKENKKTMGDKIADDILIPENILNEGDIDVDGLLFRYSQFENAETDNTLVIELPELGVIITQDLVSSGMHLWLTKDMEHWGKILKELKNKNYDIILVGHGLPTKAESYDFMIDYLKYADSLLKKYGKNNSEKITKLLKNRYPHLKGEKFIEMSLSYM